MHSGGFELTNLTYTRLEDNLIRHRGNRLICRYASPTFFFSGGGFFPSRVTGAYPVTTDLIMLVGVRTAAANKGIKQKRWTRRTPNKKLGKKKGRVILTGTQELREPFMLELA